ncbi:hypothetical protein [Cryobacterium sp. Y50]|uniref:hypothetical protein n=1 Tax=Cryobacterium sp. Y50 TaxID=2048286 RepID=UPI0011AFDE12|nr:hypothetical protein [Cryobacterium sp. Y50]
MGWAARCRREFFTLPRAEKQGLERLLLAAYGAHMMHVTFVGRTLLVGGEVAELIVEYAAALARCGGADTVRLVAYGADGDEIQILLLLGQGVSVMAESSKVDMPELDNRDVVSYMRQRLARTGVAPSSRPLDPETDSIFAFEDDFNFDS